MSRYTQTGAGDAEVSQDGDYALTGVNMQLDPALLPAGVVAEAVNYQFTKGQAEPRRGFRTAPWAHAKGKDFPWNFPIDFDQPQGFGIVYGAGEFSDPYGQRFQIIACANFAYRIDANAPVTTVRYPLNGTVTGPVTFCQAFNTLLMFRGKNATTWKLSSGVDFTQEFAFEEVPDETNEDYTSTIPQADRALALGSRVFVPYDKSRVAFSDVLSYTRYDATLSQIWVNDGDSDTLMALVPFGTNAILALKSGSIYAISGVVPDPSNQSVVQAVTLERGCIAAETARQVGNDVWFLSDGGVYAISQALDNKLQAGAQPISAPMQPLFDRVNWSAAGGACATFAEGKYFLALPVDGARHNNVLAVYDFINQSWAGWWEFDWMDAAFLIRIPVDGRLRLAIVSGSAKGYPNDGAIFILGDGYTDERFTDEASVQTDVTMRGYTLGRPTMKDFSVVVADIATWYGAGEISVIRDGVNERAEVMTFTKDRRTSYLWGKPRYNTVTNENHGESGRQDYSVALEPGGVNLNGVALGLHQDSSERMKIRQHGIALQPRVKGTRGRVVVRGIRVAFKDGQEPLKTKI